MACLSKRGSHPLPAHFQQAEFRDFIQLDLCSIQFKGLAHAVFNGPLMLRQVHIDEINNDQSTDIADT